MFIKENIKIDNSQTIYFYQIQTYKIIYTRGIFNK